MGKLSSVLRLLPMDEASRAARMAKGGYERGFWRGGKSVADGPYYTPDRSAAEAFGERHKNADIREYALRKGNSFNFHGNIKTEDMAPIVQGLKDSGFEKLAKDIHDLPDDWGGEMPASMLWQAIERGTGGDALKVFERSGFDSIDAGQEIIMLGKKGGIRDAEKAAFNPADFNKNDPFAAFAGLGLGGLVTASALTPSDASAYSVNDKLYGYPERYSYKTPKNDLLAEIANVMDAYNSKKKIMAHPLLDAIIPNMPSEIYRRRAYGETPTLLENVAAALEFL